VLIDGDNFPAELADRLFADIETLGNSIIRRVYGGSTAMANWREQARRHGIALREGTPGKNAADMHLAIDAMDILHRGRVEAFCIVSSDSDFTLLAARLREDGVAVSGFGGGHAAAGFRQACDTFVEVTKPTPPTQVVQLAVVKPQPGPQPAVSPWTKLLSEVLVHLPVGTGQMKLSELNKRVVQLDKTFSARKYGATNLKTLAIKSGLQLNKVNGDWVVVLPKALRRAA
jgi:hypothetical protein